MPGPVPERTADTLCDKEVPGPGVLSFRCTLGRGHRGVPQADPEPCYAVEVDRSVREWQTWRGRRAAAARPLGTPHKGCPGGGEYQVDLEAGLVTCTGCGIKGTVHAEPRQEDHPAPAAVEQDEVAAQFSRAGQPRGPAVEAKVNQHFGGAEDDRHVSFTESLPSRPSEDEPLAHFKVGRDGEVRPTVHAGPQHTATFRAIQQQVDGTPAPQEGLRQRPGDQPLPTKNDWPSAHDVAIEFMAGRKTLGLRRYGSVLQPFNQRDGLLDLQEELADALAYVVRLRQAQAATQDQLHDVAARAVLDGGTAYSREQLPLIAEVVTRAVDALVERFTVDTAGYEIVTQKEITGPDPEPLVVRGCDLVIGYRRRS